MFACLSTSKRNSVREPEKKTDGKVVFRNILRAILLILSFAAYGLHAQQGGTATGAIQQGSDCQTVGANYNGAQITTDPVQLKRLPEMQRNEQDLDFIPPVVNDKIDAITGQRRQ